MHDYILTSSETDKEPATDSPRKRILPKTRINIGMAIIMRLKQK